MCSHSMKVLLSVFLKNCRKDPLLVDVELPEDSIINVCGDVHGQFYDLIKILKLRGKRLWLLLGSGGGGQVVSMLAFYSVDPSLNPAQVYSFNSVNCLKRTKINQTGIGTFKIFWILTLALVAQMFRHWSMSWSNRALVSTTYPYLEV